MLAYQVISKDDDIDDREMLAILDGSIFDRYNIRNFVDSDFFHWVKNPRHFAPLKKVFRLIAQELGNFDFENVDEDILKGVYQELIDLDTRHALGEYYTPDWLCERVVQEFVFTTTGKILDPACGSGSFLRAAIYRLRNLHPALPAEDINRLIHGIDIHPLSVQIAKTTLLLALGKDITQAKKPVYLNITLANTLLAPEGVMNLFGGEFRMSIDKQKYDLTTQVLEDVRLFDEALELCDNLATQTERKKPELIADFTTILNRHYPGGGITKTIAESFYKIYLGLKEVKEKGRDSIWKFIIQNSYKPYFLNKKFEFVIGNPPWFTYADIRNEEYQNTLNALAIKQDMKPQRVANFPHLEIAAIFLAYCSDYFLQEKGQLAFVLPRSFFSADHHDNTRSGQAKGFKLTNIWDLDGVSPLFRVPSCVLFAEKALLKRALPTAGLAGKSISGRLKIHNSKWEIAAPLLTETDALWYYAQQGGSSAFTQRKYKKQNQVNPYKSEFKQGATIVPRAFYFVELAQDAPPDFADRTLAIRTSPAVQTDAKAPWKGIDFNGRIESGFLFRTALAKSILPFALYKPDMVALPLEIETATDGRKKLKLHDADSLRRQGFLEASRWFANAERIWEINKTAKSANMTSNGRVDFQRGLTSQNLNAPFLVMYNTSAKDANCVLLKRDELDLPFVVDYKTYVYYTYDENEAYYLLAIFNSETPNE